jgi:hypothetical protein
LGYLCNYEPVSGFLVNVSPASSSKLRRSKRMVLLLVVLASGSAVSASRGAIQSQAEFFDSAFQRAALPPPIGGGSGWVVTASMNMSAGSSGKEYLSARGRMTLQPDATIAGDLQLSIDKKEVANNTIRLTIRKSNPAVIVVQRQIAGKPFLGRPGKVTTLSVDPNFNYISGPISWMDGERVIQIFLETEFVKKPTDSPGGSPDKPIGSRYRVFGRLEITNAEDGTLDSTVEVSGSISLNRYDDQGKRTQSYRMYFSDRRDGIEGSIWNLEEIFVDVFDDEKAPVFMIEGSLLDWDNASSPDIMWLSCTKKFRFDQPGRVICNGDRNSESVDLFGGFTKVKDLYKK